jgi:hypothetical protein
VDRIEDALLQKSQGGACTSGVFCRLFDQQRGLEGGADVLATHPESRPASGAPVEGVTASSVTNALLAV